MPKVGRISQPPVSFFGQPPFDAGLAALAESQHTVFHVDQAVALGMSPAGVRKRAATGRLHRIYGGVYSVVPRSLLTREARWMAAVLACGRDALLSHRSAAALHGLRASAASRVDVTIPRRSGRARDGIVIHRSTTLTATDATTVSSIPCTTVARTLFDLADVIHRRSHERAFDQADALEALDLTALQDQIARNRSRPAAAKVQALLDEHYIGSTTTWSETEEAMLLICRQRKLPRFDVNRWIVLPDGGPAIRGDFIFREQRVVVEVDGRRYHGTAQAFERDRDRDQRLCAFGWRVFRVTRRQILRTPDVVGARLAAMLAL